MTDVEPGARRARSRSMDLAMAAVFAAMVAAVSVRGASITVPEIPGRYATLAKPVFTPPAAVFGPIWTMLYVLMAFAAWRAWRESSTGWLVIGVFAAQLALNALWSELFFGWHRPDFALIEIGILW